MVIISEGLTASFTATAGIATPETERELRERENQKGRAAKFEGLPREACPWTGGVAERYWLEGYDSISYGKITK